MKDSKKKTIIKLIFISIFFISSFISEFFYRKPLFDNSVSIAKKIQEKLHFSIQIFKYFTYLGVLEFLWVFLVFLFFPITYCYSFFINIVIAKHICSMAKLIYGEGRPFLLDEINADSIRYACESGYGNPSGHSFLTTSSFLGLSQLIIDKFELGILPSVIIYISSSIIILLINLSRVVLGVHSLNQVIYGDTLGFTVFFIIIIVIKPHLREPNAFFKGFLSIKYHIINMICFVVILTYIILGGVFFNREKRKDFKDLQKKLMEKCKGKENTMLTRDSIFKSLFIMGYFGMTLGLTLLSYIIKKHYNSKYKEANYYFQNINKKWYFNYSIKLCFILISFIPFFTVYYKPNDINIINLYISGAGIPMLIFGFLLFGPNIIFVISLKIANKDLYIEDIKQDKLTKDYNLEEEDDNDDNLLY